MKNDFMQNFLGGMNALEGQFEEFMGAFRTLSVTLEGSDREEVVQQWQKVNEQLKTVFESVHNESK